MTQLVLDQTKLFAPVAGQVTSLDKAPDTDLRHKRMRIGFAIEPTDSMIYSPVDGVVTSTFPTRHAIGITSGALQLLVYFGIDTIDLNGEPFENFVHVGDTVTPETAIAAMDLAAIEMAGKQTTVTVLLYDTDIQLQSYQLLTKHRVAAGTLTAEIITR
ncbi:hypothetical protein IV38_GL001577 [Lactobacillus selangorensis]|uniref:PTS EIIA type-1 domain-containing protein n=1 Tax=Lactobacillus selangorensis TaxID=81857 RepID=A0A0R2FIN2_9LACO|nr:PTS glucose transporter subunit IIA [Lactobacillus selangorensis]KRN28126.1 hypothetical protein IV38_GL001577 [Lactobacillus selangorensis]KRN30997.1 hypothetical protein IV40_GL001638 [Lactobacillus selangorensis]